MATPAECPDPMAERPAPAENLSFEKALEELETLVARMEDGKLPLEDSLAAYQRGAELIRYCETKLTDAQARIAILEGGELRDLKPSRDIPESGQT
jgi:exodeoxyribonuclease VII small subunit